VATIFKDVKELCTGFPSFHFNFVHRLANAAAHLCAKNASADRLRCTRVNMILSFLTSCLQLNCNSTVSTELNAPGSQKKETNQPPLIPLTWG
jgi:hypothetical protein